MYKNDGVTRRYSESFKLKILAELSTGKYSKRQLSRNLWDTVEVQSMNGCESTTAKI